MSNETKRSGWGLWGWGLVLLWAAQASAVDGVFEINQACAAGPGCFSGDAPGLPVRLTQPGSYRLTSNLATGSDAVTAIEVATSDASIDMNGFVIACSFATFVPPSCTSTFGLGAGVAVDDPLVREGISLHDGVIRSMGGDGVRVGRHARIERIQIRDNGGDGLEVGLGSRVADNVIWGNGGVGMRWPLAPFGSEIRGGYVGNVVDGNAGGAIVGNQSPAPGALGLGPNICNGSICP